MLREVARVVRRHNRKSSKPAAENSSLPNRMISSIDTPARSSPFSMSVTGPVKLYNRPQGENRPMRNPGLRLIPVLLCVVALTTAYERTKTTVAMANAANNFLALLTPEQKAKTTYPVDDKQRVDWHFVPRERKGLPLREMDAAQRAMAEVLLSSGLSQDGYAKVSRVLSLEPVLKEAEKDTRGRRDAAGYFFTIFGEPSPSATWGWRFEGHHVALNYTVV